jgi:hypothetical protein
LDGLLHKNSFDVPTPAPGDGLFLGASLKGVDRQGAHVPGTALWLKLNVMGDGTTLEI